MATETSPSTYAPGNSPATPGSCSPGLWRGSGDRGRYTYDATQAVGSFPKGSTKNHTRENAVGKCAQDLKRRGIVVTDEDRRLMKAQKIHEGREVYAVKSAVSRFLCSFALFFR